MHGWVGGYLNSYIPTKVSLSSWEFPVHYLVAVEPLLLNKKQLVLLVHHKPCDT